MARAVFETFGFFFAPFALFAVFLALRARFPLAVEHWTRGRLSWLTLTGLAAAGRPIERSYPWQCRKRPTPAGI